MQWKENDPVPPYPNTWMAALFVALATAGISVLSITIAVLSSSSYGWALFVVLPMVSGGLVVVMRGRHENCSLGAFVKTGLLSMLMMGGCTIFLGIEGLVCTAMAFPIWFCFMFIGILFTFPVHRALWKNRASKRGFDVIILFALMLAIPTSMGADSTGAATPPTVEISTTIDIDATPEEVWPLVAACGPIDEQPDLLFRMGVAYPVATTISGSGTGACRTCLLSTGPMLETVTTWNPGSLLVFKVDSVPDSMKEWSPLGEIHPPHLHGYFKTLKGQFQLLSVRGPDGRIRTRLIGTSWYQNQMAPQWYWQLWCDTVVHGVQSRVMLHIKQVAELHHATSLNGFLNPQP